jgi:adenylate cyclase
MPTDPPLQQRLVAILHADVAGYSRLSGADELGTHRRLRACLDSIENLIRRHSGRIANHAGDAVLAEFDKASNALVCAVDIQRAMTACNREVPADRQIRFRIGISLGEVIVDHGDIFGDGVNVAARLDALAEPGGVLISGAVHDAIGSKLPLGYEYLGEKQVKNIERPIRVYRVTADEGVELHAVAEQAASPREKRRLPRYAMPALVAAGLVVAAMLAWHKPWMPAERPAGAAPGEAVLPGKPTIAVMPFANISGDVGQEYFTDGITEDLITDLSRVSALSVIAKNSSFSYKGRSVNVQQIGRELGAQYVLEGSVRKSKDDLRITAQLVSTGEGRHLWAERYDRKLSDVFQLQDEIAQKIVSALLVRLTGEEREMLAEKSTRNFKAYDLLLKGLESYLRTTREDMNAAQGYYREAIALDPAFGRAYGAYSVALARSVNLGWADRPLETLDRALELAREAVRLSPSLPQTNWALGFVYMQRAQFEDALKVLEETVRKYPNYADGYGLMALVQNRLGHAREAIDLIKKGMALNPFYSYDYPYNVGRAHYTLGQFDEAVRFLKEALERNAAVPHPRLFLVASYVGLGRLDEARWEITELTVSYPELTLAQITGIREIADPELLKRFVADLRKAGLPE